MNILIPHSWLLEHLETEASPEEVQKYLSLAGPSVERIYHTQGEAVYDIEITTNRVDSMSIRGIAREAAVILEQFGLQARLKPLKLIDQTTLQLTKELPLPKIFNHPQLNKRTICIVLQNVKRTPTPSWMATRLTQVEMNIHDTAIDITNYVTHEIGHPLHAFDYDKLMNTGGEIHIIEANEGETFTTLDGETFTTVGGEVVFKNGQGQIIDLPSIKGTANTSIDESTQNVLLLAESIRADKVRFASMTHAIRTVAAQLMEKNVDPHLAEPALLKAVQLYQELCQAKISSKVYDDFSTTPKPKPIKIKLSKIDDYLGLEIDTKKIIKILTDLECRVNLKGEKRRAELIVTPPTFRSDLTIPADIIEEIARIYGYHNLPSQLMKTAIPITYPQNVDFRLENKIKHFLSNIGWQEVYTYSMVSEKIAKQAGDKLTTHLKLQNPLTDERVYLRRSLLPSLTEIIDSNPQVTGLNVFELANVYLPTKNNLPQEKMMLSLVSTHSYRRTRGMLETLLKHLFITDYEIAEINPSPTLFTQAAQLKVQDQTLGLIGVLESGQIGIEISLAQLLLVAQAHPRYQPIPTTMPIIEDLTFTLSQQIALGKLIKTIKQLHSLIKSVELKDVYQRNYTLTIKYHDFKKNLIVDEIEPIRKAIVQQVEQNWPAKLVGAV